MSPAIPIYSRRLWSVRNFAGTYSLFNPGPDLYIVRTVTVYYGGLGACNFGLNDENGAAMLVQTLDPTGVNFQVWSSLHLVWGPGETWELSTNLGADMTGHGYELAS